MIIRKTSYYYIRGFHAGALCAVIVALLAGAAGVTVAWLANRPGTVEPLSAAIDWNKEYYVFELPVTFLGCLEYRLHDGEQFQSWHIKQAFQLVVDDDLKSALVKDVYFDGSACFMAAGIDVRRVADPDWCRYAIPSLEDPAVVLEGARCRHAIDPDEEQGKTVRETKGDREDMVGVHITYGTTLIRRSELPKALQEELSQIPVTK